MWDLSSPTRDQVWAPALEAQNLNQWIARKSQETNLKKKLKNSNFGSSMFSLPTGPITRVAFEAQFPNTPNLDSNIISLLESYLLSEVCLSLCIY